MIEKTLFIIKPDGFEMRDDIVVDISKCFNIIEQSRLMFTERLVADFYPNDINKPHYAALAEYMLENYSQLGFIEGENVIQSFFEIAGKYSDPIRCHQNSLRFKYGKGFDKTASGLYLTKNAIHRAISQEEFEYELGILKNHGLI